MRWCLDGIGVVSIVGNVFCGGFNDGIIVSEDDFIDFEWGFDGVGLVVDLVKLFEGVVLGFNVVEIRWLVRCN